MTAECPCGRPMGDFGGVEGVAYCECRVCSQNGGEYRKSDYYNHERDKRDERNVKDSMAWKNVTNNVVPLKKKRGKR